MRTLFVFFTGVFAGYILNERKEATIDATATRIGKVASSARDQVFDYLDIKKD